jgi:peptidoglycan hydrolase-like protein with peptidoglycan-binding domain
MTKELNMKIQNALKEAGFYNGPVDGSIGRGTMNSVNKYQIEKGLPRGGLTIKVLQDLGVM